MGRPVLSSGLHWVCNRFRQNERHLRPATTALRGLDPVLSFLVRLRVLQVYDISVR